MRFSVHGYVEVPCSQICDRMDELGDYWFTTAFHFSRLGRILEPQKSLGMTPEITKQLLFSVRVSVHECVEVPCSQICDRMGEFGDYWFTTAFHDRDISYTVLSSIAFQKCDRSISAPGPTTSIYQPIRNR